MIAASSEDCASLACFSRAAWANWIKIVDEGGLG